MHHLLGKALLLLASLSLTSGCIPTKHPEPGIPAATPAPATPAPCMKCGVTNEVEIDKNPANGAKPFISDGPPCTEWKFVCGGSSIQLNSQISVFDADDGTTDGKITVTLTCGATWWQYNTRNIYKIGCYT